MNFRGVSGWFQRRFQVDFRKISRHRGFQRCINCSGEFEKCPCSDFFFLSVIAYEHILLELQSCNSYHILIIRFCCWFNVRQWQPSHPFVFKFHTFNGRCFKHITLASLEVYYPWYFQLWFQHTLFLVAKIKHKV